MSLAPLRPAVFLDRDGVLNRMLWSRQKMRSPTRLEDFEFLPGVHDAVKILRQRGYVLVVVTNQPDPARGWMERCQVDAMNARVRAELAVDDVKVCFHVEADTCRCRKPKPGMLLDAARELALDLPRSWIVGDRYTDILAGRAAGVRTILVGEPDDDAVAEPDCRARDLGDALNWIL